MEFEKHKAKMNQHTTSIVLSTHKSSITSPQLEMSVIDSPPPPSPPHKERKDKEKRKKERKHHNKKEENNDDNNNSKNKKIKRIYRLPTEIITKISEFLTFEEIFKCMRVCKKMNTKFTRLITSRKMCSTVETVDIKLLCDPNSFIDGVTFYRIKNNNNICGFSKLDLSDICNSHYNSNNNKNNSNNNKNDNNITNSVYHSEVGQVAYHLKQLEPMVVYNTVNGNELVRAANNWIFFNRKLFFKITDKVAEANGAEQDDRLYLVDIILVEANLNRKPKTSLFGRATTPSETFCQMTLDGLHLRSSVTTHEEDPIWNEDSSFTVRKNSTNKLKITMLEFSKIGRHTRLGNVEICLKDLACNLVHDVWQPIVSIEEGFTGKFHVMIHKSPIPKKEVDSRTLGMLGHCGPICDTVPIRCELGDIILISNSEFYTHIAKLGTLSVWDHVAMVVERRGELHLFESTPDGVFTSPLARRLKFYLRGSTLGVRRLTIDRTPEMKRALKSFIKEVDGRPYKQNWMDLVRAWQGSHTEEDLSSIFCSELVAAAYKRMGLMDNKTSSNNFLPVDFAMPNTSKVKLLQGRLEKIRMIYSSEKN